MDFDVTATAVIDKQSLFDGLRLRKNRYTVTLFINEIETPVHVHCSRRKLKAVSAFLTTEANRILHESGHMPAVREALEAVALANLPQLGTAIELTADLGKGFPIGLRGKVSTPTWKEDLTSVFPIAFSPEGSTDSTVPLRVGEWKVVA